MGWQRMYAKKRELGHYIAERVKDTQNTLGLEPGELAKLCSKEMEIKENTAKGFISNIRNGGITYLPTIPDNSSKSGVNYLRRLSILLYTLNISENDEMIIKIKDFYDNFIYPPNIIEDESPLEEQIQKLTEKDQQFIGRLVNRLLSNYEEPQNPY